LIEAARSIIRRRYQPDWHVVGAALRTRSGRIWTGVHLEAHVGRIAVCAEAIALGRAITEGDSQITTIVAVRHPGNDSLPSIVPPCGMCRELISDYAPEAIVLLGPNDHPARVPIRELLPRKYERIV
jgi:cytidine deaminase